MGSLFTYSLYSATLLLAFYLIYKILMAEENQHAYNRAILLACYAASIIIPVLPTLSHLLTHISIDRNIADISIDTPMVSFMDTAPSQTQLWPVIIISVYFLGVVISLCWSIICYIRLYHIVKTYDKYPSHNGYTIVLTNRQDIAPFSWFSYIVMNHSDYVNHSHLIEMHELEHLHRRHWIDLIIAQLFVIFQWFNPTAWLMREELRAVHEYQADKAVLTGGADARQYQLLLIKKAVGKSFPALANSLNHSKLKKRITMMLKNKSSKGRRTLALALVPAALAAVAVFNIPAVASVVNELSNASWPQQESTPKVTKKLSVQTTPQSSNPESKQSAATATAAAVIKTKDETAVISQTAIKLDGETVSVDQLDEVKPESVSSITVNRQKNTIEITTRNDEPQKAAEVMPSFPGGDAALLKFVSDNIKYPENVPDDRETHRVVVQFQISETGKPHSPKILRSAGEAYDIEAIRIIGELPDFIPGTINGKPVNVTYTLPINFKLYPGEEKK